jgi:hypothetical protein
MISELNQDFGVEAAGIIITIHHENTLTGGRLES